MVMGELPTQTDVLIIGGGPAGYAAAFRCADLGQRVTLVDDNERLGGTCLLRGCIPSKALLSMTSLLHQAARAEAAGIRFGRPKIDFEKLQSWKQHIVDGLADGLHEICKRRGIEVVLGRARFLDARTARIEGGQGSEISFQHAVVASGSRPALLPDTAVRPAGPILDSTGALELSKVPKSLLVVGGGYIGLELGQVYAGLGAEVTLVEVRDRLMPEADQDLTRPLAKRLREELVEVHVETEVTSLQEANGGVSATFENASGSDEKRFDCALICIGRRPNTDELGLENTGIELDSRGRIEVDEQLRTKEASIFAVGDVVPGMQLAHEAMLHGKVAAEAIAGQATAYDARAVPAVVYTDPEIAWCGLTEQEAKRDGGAVKVTRFPWQASGRARTMNAAEGLTKLVFDADDGRLLGLGAVGHGAEGLVAEAVLALEMGAVAEDLARTIHPHPTLSETIAEAAELYAGLATHLAPKTERRKRGKSG